MKHLFLSILLTLLFPVVYFSQPCIDTVAYDNIETFNIIAVDIKDPFKACSDETFYDLNGKEVDIKEVPSGVYLRKCGTAINKIIKQ
jgi:hypothetical protein